MGQSHHRGGLIGSACNLLGRRIGKADLETSWLLLTWVKPSWRKTKAPTLTRELEAHASAMPVAATVIHAEQVSRKEKAILTRLMIVPPPEKVR